MLTVLILVVSAKLKLCCHYRLWFSPILAYNNRYDCTLGKIGPVTKQPQGIPSFRERCDGHIRSCRQLLVGNATTHGRRHKAIQPFQRLPGAWPHASCSRAIFCVQRMPPRLRIQCHRTQPRHSRNQQQRCGGQCGK